MGLLKTINSSLIFWGAWIIIPVLMEILPSFGSMFVLVKRRITNRKGFPKPAIFPEISIIVPVYNSAGTLMECLGAIDRSTYPNKAIRIFLVDNGSRDDSFAVYTRCQLEYPELNIQWLSSEQGKSRALNLALYNSNGKYIINIDSDGELEPHALENLVTRFEAKPELNCMTGTILTIPEKIRQERRFFVRLLQNLEFMEYAQAFLAGRSYASELNSVYTLSGAFSAFRRQAILSSRMFSADTLCEDTQLTFQMRYLLKQRVEVCENAIFLTDPIEGFNKLYTQRQRWQRGSLEVAEMFNTGNMNPVGMVTDSNVRTLMFDHTFAFPRMIWYLALLCMIFMRYSSRAVIISTGVIIALYILVGYAYFIGILIALHMTPAIRKYYLSHWWTVALLPFFNMGVFFIRLAGIINSIDQDSSWTTKNLTNEWESFASVVKKDAGGLFRFHAFLCRCVNRKSDAQKERPSGKKAPKQASRCVPISWYLLFGMTSLLSIALLYVVFWVGKTYGVSLDVLVNTLTGNLQGTSKEVIWAVVKGCVLPVIGIAAVFFVVVALDRRRERSRGAGDGQGQGTVLSRLLPYAACCLLIVSALYGTGKLDALTYFLNKNTASGENDFYEEFYVSPDSVSITGEHPKNLIYIYLESMETTYSSQDAGGVQPDNYIPELTALAGKNLSFSDSETLGGFHTVGGAGYTMAAIYATTSGVPYSLPVDTTVIAETQSFASGLITLGDVLAEKGYTQEFLCGSDAAFGGRKLYFQQHGGYQIFDLYTAREKEYIPGNYFVWWGFEDSKLFDIAREEATRLASGEEPFNLTMLTVDLHHIAGYTCSQCGNQYDERTANVCSCTDRLTGEFIAWCQSQPFYKDTVIVVTGDHPRMDTYLVDGVNYYDRTIYNCFINSASTSENTKNREFTHMDIFPTVLSAMGFEIEGDRLGLGTNLFSDKSTLAEETGFYLLDARVRRSSDYYVRKFAPELSK